MSILAECRQLVSSLMGTAREPLSVESWSGEVSLRTPFRTGRFVAFDMEMSGLKPRRDFIVSIGAVMMTGSVIHAGRTFYRLVRPEGELKPDSVVIHGITPDELQNGDGLDTVLKDFLGFIKDAVLLGHFLHFDLRFLNAALKRLFGTKLRNPAIDTHDIHEWLMQNSSDFRRHYPGVSARKDLFYVAERYGVAPGRAHDALSDAFVAAQLFQRFAWFLESSGIETLEDLIDIGRA